MEDYEKRTVPEETMHFENVQQIWHCDIYCRKIRHVTCEGRAGADPAAAELCPYFDEMLY